jgi:hypothetical protein
MSFDNFESFAFRPTDDFPAASAKHHITCMYHMHQPWSKAKLGRQAAVVVRQSFLVSPVHPAVWPAQPDVSLDPASPMHHQLWPPLQYKKGVVWVQHGHRQGTFMAAAALVCILR